MRALFIAVVAVFAPVSLVPAQTRPPTILDGVYTESQAARGEMAYGANCARCHRETLEGNAEALSLTGTRFMESWRDDTLDALFTHMRTRMPRRPGGEPGSLSESTYLDILAYVLKVNGFPVGSGELTAERARETLFVDKDGPKPLATNALVQVVGCFTPGPNKANKAWMLENTTEPLRARNAEETTPDEIKAAASRPPGTQTFGLRNLPDFRPGFAPESLEGHRVLVKGALTRQPKNDRIYVMALESVAPACSP
jgi:mono/diheme cytochrome c family protein